jgi:two-component system response regulator YesN
MDRYVGLLNIQDESVLKMMRDRTFVDFVTHPFSGTHMLKERWLSLGLTSRFTFPAIALIEPSYTSKEAQSIQYHIEKARTLIERFVRDDCIVLRDDHNRIVLIFSWETRGIIENIYQLIKQNFSWEVNIGVGDPYGKLSDLQQSYFHAASSLAHKFYQGKDRIIYYSNMNQYQKPCSYPIDKEKELFGSLKSADGDDGIGRSIDSFFEYILRNGPIEIKGMYEIAIRLLIGLENRWLSESSSESALNKCQVISIVHMATLQEIKNFLKAYLIDLCRILVGKNNCMNSSLIKETIWHMEQECQLATLNRIARKVYITPTYLSLLFKIHTGKTFIEQLTDIRIDKAKYLLKNTHLKHYEIAGQVGYQDSRYFSQIFKKKVGLSPSNYREAEQP